MRVEQLDHLLWWPTQCQDTSHDDSYILYALLYSSKYRHAHREGASSRVNTDSGYAPAPTQSVFLYLAITTSHLAPNQEKKKNKTSPIKIEYISVLDLSMSKIKLCFRRTACSSSSCLKLCRAREMSKWLCRLDAQRIKQTDCKPLLHNGQVVNYRLQNYEASWSMSVLQADSDEDDYGDKCPTRDHSWETCVLTWWMCQVNTLMPYS